MNVFKSATKMGVTMDVALNGFNRCCSGCYDRMGVKTTYTGQEEQEPPVDTENSIFCEFTNLEADYCCFWVRLLNFIKFTSILQKILPHNSKISSPATNNSLPVS